MENVKGKPKRKTKFEKLVEEIPDIEKHIEEDNVKVIKVRNDSKIPSENDYYKAPSTIEKLKKHNGNFGIIVGYNHKKNNKSLAVIDIDGYSLGKGSEDFFKVKQETKEYIFNCLKEVLPNTIAVKTQSGGYHLYLWNETVIDNFHDVSKALTFPEDYEIKELQGKSLEHSIEIFTKEGSKQVVLPSSSIYSNAMEKDYFYKVISDVNKLSDMALVNNVHEEVKKGLIAKGFGYNEELLKTSRKRKKRKTSTKKKATKKLKKLSDKEIAKVVELTVPIFKAIEGSKHEGTLALGGFFSYHITKMATRKIATGIVKEIGSLFEDSEAFKKTLLVSYERPVEEKAGLPTLLDLIESLDSTFNTAKLSEELNLICNKNFLKEKVATTVFKIEVPVESNEEESEKEVQVKEIKVPVYLYENDYSKWLKYEGIVEGIDLTLDLTSFIGSFIYTKTGKEVDSFKFKFKNRFLEIAKTTLKELTEFLAEEEIVLPKNFEKTLRRSLKNLDKGITKPKVIEEDIVEAIEEDVPEDVIIFGRTEEYFFQQSEEEGIEVKIITKKSIITKPVANVVIRNITIVLDSLGILEPVYNVTYYNKTFEEEITVEHLTGKELTEEFIKAKVFYSSKSVENVINAFIIDAKEEGVVTVKKEAYLEGFYIVEGKVVENTKLKYLKPYTAEDVAEAITLLNEIMKDRTEEGKANDSTVYRFSLWNPYSYCLKQIGYKTGIYSLILIGISKGNKTGAINIGKLFYLNTEEENSGSTASVLGSKLEENSFSKIFDECYNLLNLPEVPDIMKKAVQDLITRITKDRTDNKKTDKFNAFGLPVFLLNERMEFKDYIRERYKITEYTSKSYVSKSKRTAFNEKYVPEDKEGTVLRKLAVIGNEFKKKIVPLIEAKDKRLLKPEEVTIEILKEIATETSTGTGKPIDFLPEMYNIEEASTNYNYDVASEIRKLLNTEFKTKNRITANNVPSGFTFTQSAINNDFDFLTYNKNRTKNTADRHFIINASKLVKYVNNHVEETVELENLLKYLSLEEVLKEKAEANNVPYEKFIKTQYKVQIEGSSKKKNITGFYLTVEEVANNLFDFNINFSDPEHKEELVKIQKVENKN